MAAAFFRLSGLVLNLKNGTLLYQVTQIWLKNHNYTFEDLEKIVWWGFAFFFFLRLIKQRKYLNVNGRTAEVSKWDYYAIYSLLSFFYFFKDEIDI